MILIRQISWLQAARRDFEDEVQKDAVQALSIAARGPTRRSRSRAWTVGLSRSRCAIVATPSAFFTADRRGALGHSRIQEEIENRNQDATDGG
jgi:hypothetical protein